MDSSVATIVAVVPMTVRSRMTTGLSTSQPMICESDSRVQVSPPPNPETSPNMIEAIGSEPGVKYMLPSTLTGWFRAGVDPVSRY